MKKNRKVETTNFNNKNIDKNLLWETEEKKDNNCPCWVCKEQIDKVKNVQRQNYLPDNIISFSY